jgi:hypothetical protein
MRDALCSEQLGFAVATLILLAPLALAAAPLGAAACAAAAALPAACVLLAVACVAGWVPHSPELRSSIAAPVTALASGAVALAASLLRPPSRVSAAYGAAFAATAAGACLAVLAPFEALRLAGIAATDASPLLCQLAAAGAVPAAAACAVLADAAGRGRLGGSTFRHLNAAIATAGALTAVAHVAAAAMPSPAFWVVPAVAAATAALCAAQFAAAPRKK